MMAKRAPRLLTMGALTSPVYAPSILPEYILSPNHHGRTCENMDEGVDVERWRADEDFPVFDVRNPQ